MLLQQLHSYNMMDIQCGGSGTPTGPHTGRQLQLLTATLNVILLQTSRDAFHSVLSLIHDPNFTKEVLF